MAAAAPIGWHQHQQRETCYVLFTCLIRWWIRTDMIDMLVPCQHVPFITEACRHRNVSSLSLIIGANHLQLLHHGSRNTKRKEKPEIRDSACSLDRPFFWRKPPNSAHWLETKRKRLGCTRWRRQPVHWRPSADVFIDHFSSEIWLSRVRTRFRQSICTHSSALYGRTTLILSTVAGANGPQGQPVGDGWPEMNSGKTLNGIWTLAPDASNRRGSR